MEQQGIHHSVLDAVRSIQRPRTRQQQREQPNPSQLLVRGDPWQEDDVNRQSVQYLVDFIQEEDSHNITELCLISFYLADDGGWEVLRDFIANDRIITKILLNSCDFGTAEAASQIISAFETNLSVKDLFILEMHNLSFSALGSCLSGILQHNTHLEILNCPSLCPREDALAHIETIAIRALQPGLLIVDALVGNMVLEALDISRSSVTWEDLTRLVEFTRLKKIGIFLSPLLCEVDPSDEPALRRFMQALHQNTILEETAGLDLIFDTYCPARTDVIESIFARNRSINRAKALLQLQPRTGLPIRSKSGIWYMAFAKMSPRSQPSGSSDDDDTDGDDDDDVDGVHTGASAIFKILQARPAILERQLRRPAAAAAPQDEQESARRHQQSTAVGNGSVGGANSSLDRTAPAQKRRRRS